MSKEKVNKVKHDLHFHGFPGHFLALFHTFSHFFLQNFFLELRGFTTVLVQRDEKRKKEINKKKTKPFCTLVVARLSSSYYFLAPESVKRCLFRD